MKSILMCCPSEIDVHIKVTKTNDIPYSPAAVSSTDNVAFLHQGATLFCTT